MTTSISATSSCNHFHDALRLEQGGLASFLVLLTHSQVSTSGTYLKAWLASSTSVDLEHCPVGMDVCSLVYWMCSCFYPRFSPDIPFQLANDYRNVQSLRSAPSLLVEADSINVNPFKSFMLIL